MFLAEGKPVGPFNQVASIRFKSLRGKSYRVIKNFNKKVSQSFEGKDESLIDQCPTS